MALKNQGKSLYTTFTGAFDLIPERLRSGAKITLKETPVDPATPFVALDSDATLLQSEDSMVSRGDNFNEKYQRLWYVEGGFRTVIDSESKGSDQYLPDAFQQACIWTTTTTIVPVGTQPVEGPNIESQIIDLNGELAVLTTTERCEAKSLVRGSEYTGKELFRPEDFITVGVTEIVKTVVPPGTAPDTGDRVKSDVTEVGGDQAIKTTETHVATKTTLADAEFEGLQFKLPDVFSQVGQVTIAREIVAQGTAALEGDRIKSQVRELPGSQALRTSSTYPEAKEVVVDREFIGDGLRRPDEFTPSGVIEQVRTIVDPDQTLPEGDAVKSQLEELPGDQALLTVETHPTYKTSVLVEEFVGEDLLIPESFRNTGVVTTTKTIVTPGTSPSTSSSGRSDVRDIAGDQALKTVEAHPSVKSFVQAREFLGDELRLPAEFVNSGTRETQKTIVDPTDSLDEAANKQITLEEIQGEQGLLTETFHPDAKTAVVGESYTGKELLLPDVFINEGATALSKTVVIQGSSATVDPAIKSVVEELPGAQALRTDELHPSAKSSVEGAEFEGEQFYRPDEFKVTDVVEILKTIVAPGTSPTTGDAIRSSVEELPGEQALHTVSTYPTYKTATEGRQFIGKELLLPDAFTNTGVTEIDKTIVAPGASLTTGNSTKSQLEEIAGEQAIMSVEVRPTAKTILADGEYIGAQLFTPDEFQTIGIVEASREIVAQGANPDTGATIKSDVQEIAGAQALRTTKDYPVRKSSTSAQEFVGIELVRPEIFSNTGIAETTKTIILPSADVTVGDSIKSTKQELPGDQALMVVTDFEAAKTQIEEGKFTGSQFLLPEAFQQVAPVEILREIVAPGEAPEVGNNVISEVSGLPGEQALRVSEVHQVAKSSVTDKLFVGIELLRPDSFQTVGVVETLKTIVLPDAAITEADDVKVTLQELGGNQALLSTEDHPASKSSTTNPSFIGDAWQLPEVFRTTGIVEQVATIVAAGVDPETGTLVKSTIQELPGDQALRSTETLPALKSAINESEFTGKNLLLPEVFRTVDVVSKVKTVVALETEATTGNNIVSSVDEAPGDQAILSVATHPAPKSATDEGSYVGDNWKVPEVFQTTGEITKVQTLVSLGAAPETGVTVKSQVDELPGSQALRTTETLPALKASVLGSDSTGSQFKLPEMFQVDGVVATTKTIVAPDTTATTSAFTISKVEALPGEQAVLTDVVYPEAKTEIDESQFQGKSFLLPEEFVNVGRVEIVRTIVARNSLADTGDAVKSEVTELPGDQALKVTQTFVDFKTSTVSKVQTGKSLVLPNVFKTTGNVSMVATKTIVLPSATPTADDDTKSEITEIGGNQAIQNDEVYPEPKDTVTGAEYTGLGYLRPPVFDTVGQTVKELTVVNPGTAAATGEFVHSTVEETEGVQAIKTVETRPSTKASVEGAEYKGKELFQPENFKSIGEATTVKTIVAQGASAQTGDDLQSVVEELPGSQALRTTITYPSNKSAVTGASFSGNNFLLPDVFQTTGVVAIQQTIVDPDVTIDESDDKVVKLEELVGNQALLTEEIHPEVKTIVLGAKYVGADSFLPEAFQAVGQTSITQTIVTPGTSASSGDNVESEVSPLPGDQALLIVQNKVAAKSSTAGYSYRDARLDFPEQFKNVDVVSKIAAIVLPDSIPTGGDNLAIEQTELGGNQALRITETNPAPKTSISGLSYVGANVVLPAEFQQVGGTDIDKTLVSPGDFHIYSANDKALVEELKDAFAVRTIETIQDPKTTVLGARYTGKNLTVPEPFKTTSAVIVSKTIVVAGASVPDSDVNKSHQIEEIQGAQAILTTEEHPAPKTTTDSDSYIGSELFLPDAFKNTGFITKLNELVSLGTDPSTGASVKSEITELRGSLAIRTTETFPAAKSELTEFEFRGHERFLPAPFQESGLVEVTKTLVERGSEPDSGGNVESQVDEVQGNLAIRTTKTYPVAESVVVADQYSGLHRVLPAEFQETGLVTVTKTIVALNASADTGDDVESQVDAVGGGLAILTTANHPGTKSTTEGRKFQGENTFQPEEFRNVGETVVVKSVVSPGTSTTSGINVISQVDEIQGGQAIKVDQTLPGNKTTVIDKVQKGLQWYAPEIFTDTSAAVVTTKTITTPDASLSPSATQQAVLTELPGSQALLSVTERPERKTALENKDYIGKYNFVPDALQPVATITEDVTLVNLATAITTGVDKVSHLEELPGAQRLLRVKTVPTPSANRTVVQWNKDWGGFLSEVVTKYNQDDTIPAAAAFGTYSSELDIIKGGVIGKQEKLATDEEFTEIFEEVRDDDNESIIRIGRVVVEAGSEISGPGPGDYFYEFKGLDKYHSIQIRSKVISAPEDRAVPLMINHSFPDELLGASLQGVYAYGTVGGVTQFAYDIGLVCDIREGYSGPCQAVYEELFSTDVPDAEEPTLFFPQAYQFAVGWTYQSVSGTRFGTVDARIFQFTIPSVITPGMDVSFDFGGPEGGGANPAYTIAPTTPSIIPHGSLMVVDCNVKKWRLGYWVKERVSLYIP